MTESGYTMGDHFFQRFVSETENFVLNSLIQAYCKPMVRFQNRSYMIIQFWSSCNGTGSVENNLERMIQVAGKLMMDLEIDEMC